MSRITSVAAFAFTLLAGLARVKAAELPTALGPESLNRLFDDTALFWKLQFTQLGGHYQAPILSPYHAQVSGVCAQKDPLSGAFYCPADQHVYLDPQALQAIGVPTAADNALAEGFVVAHLVAHHVQFLIGTTAAVQQARSTSTAQNANHTLVTMELQADCYAGLWLHSAAQRGVLTVTPAALATALTAVGDDSLARAHRLAAGTVVPDPMDTGTAAQRLRWTERGFESGNFEECDTFGAAGRGEL
jgi:uncharacterized protein